MPHELILQDYRVKAPKPTLIPRLIKIYHPGYHDEVVPLISFSGYDSQEGHLWYDLAHTACAIISNNQFDGWLSTSRDAQSPRFSGELLAPGDYWWHLPGGSTYHMKTLRCAISTAYKRLVLTQPYAIIADFRDWPFPGQLIPDDWKSSTPYREQAETSCQVSQEDHALNEAHIVPSSETEWFCKSGLGFSYGSNATKVGSTALDIGIDNDNNLLNLRSDLHHAWDQRKFTFVPKRTKEGSKIVMHCWNENMVTAYHNVPLHGFVRRELLLARLAWTLLPRAMTHFLMATKETRMIWSRDEHGQLISQKKTAEQCWIIANAPIPRTTSPKKRKQNNDQQVTTTRKTETRRSHRCFDSGLELGEEGEEYEEHSSDNDDSSSQSSVDLEERTRGRKRLRAGDDWTTYPERILSSDVKHSI